MTKEELNEVLNLCEARESEGWSVMPDGRFLTLHLASAGVGLTVSRIMRLRWLGAQLQTLTARDETYVFSVSEVFAGAFEDSGSKARKAGFV